MSVLKLRDLVLSLLNAWIHASFAILESYYPILGGAKFSSGLCEFWNASRQKWFQKSNTDFLLFCLQNLKVSLKFCYTRSVWKFRSLIFSAKKDKFRKGSFMTENQKIWHSIGQDYIPKNRMDRKSTKINIC